MKLNKKLMGQLLIGSIVMSSAFNSVYTYASDTHFYASNINGEEDNAEENLVDVLNNEAYNSIKKIDFNDSNASDTMNAQADYDEYETSTMSLENYNSRKARSEGVDLADGTYVVDRKDGWILGGDKGFLQSIIIPAGATGTISTSKTRSASNSFSVVASAGFDLDFVSAAVKAGYGYSTETASTISIDQSITAPEDKSLFVKAQTVHRRFDTVNIRNNQIVDMASTYIPVSHTLTKMEFEPGTRVNQSRLFEKVTRNIFGDQETDNKHLTDKNVSYEKATNSVKQNDRYLFKILSGKSNTAGLYFDVQSSGKYNISSDFSSYREAFGYVDYAFGTGVDMTLYKVSNKNDTVIEKVVASVGTGKIYDDVKYTEELARRRAENQLTIDLKKGEKYFLVLNNNKTKFKYNNQGDTFSYTVYFDKQ